jgi:hypothetical protein
MKATRGKRHNYLGMIFNYYLEDKLKVDVEYYIDKIVEEFLEELNRKEKGTME